MIWQTTDAALEAHLRMPSGTRFIHLTDDAETKTEIEAEKQRQRQLAWKKREQAAAKAAGMSHKAWIRARRAAR